MKPCTRPGCDQPKAPGQGARFCPQCRTESGAARKVANLRRLREWSDENPDYVRECRRANGRKPEARARFNASRRKWRAADPRETWSISLRERFNITADQYDAILLAQNGCCALCGRDADTQQRRLHVDHDHRCCPENGRSCGKCIRGLLCFGCNRLLGWYERRRIDVEEYVDQTLVPKGKV